MAVKGQKAGYGRTEPADRSARDSGANPSGPGRSRDSEDGNDGGRGGSSDFGGPRRADAAFQHALESIGDRTAIKAGRSLRGDRSQERPFGGAVPDYRHPSAGQVLSGLGNAFSLGTGSVGGLIGGVATSDEYGRTLMGRAFDNLTGGTPEAPAHWSVPHSAYNLDSRGEKPTQMLNPRDGVGTATVSKAAAPKPAKPAKPAPANDGDHPDAVLQDRRRPYSLYAGTDLLARWA